MLCAIPLVMVGKTFEARVRELRLKIGISQAELARRMGVQVQSVVRYEHGTLPRSGNGLALARELGASLDFLLTGKPR